MRVVNGSVAKIILQLINVFARLLPQICKKFLLKFYS
jgi:hypothetical protein